MMNPKKVSSEEAVMPTPLRVLILEDEPADAELMAYELRRAGFDPHWQRVKAESDYLAHLDPALDIILADYRLPQFDAMCALQRLQERGLDVPFIVVSGAITEEVAVECMKRGATDYLLKDRLARLGQAVAQALEQRRLRRERERAEEEVREMNVALKHAMPGISRLDPEGRYAQVNEAYARMIGYEPGEMVGTDWALTVHPDDRENASVAYHRMVSEGKAEFEARGVRKDGSVFHKHVLMVRRADNEGNFIGHHCFMRDISERRWFEETLQALYRASLVIQEPLELRERLDRLLQTARDVLGLDRVNILLADPEERWLQALASLGIDDPLEVIRIPIGPEGGGLAQTYLNRQVIFCDGQTPVPDHLRLKPPYDSVEAFRSRAFVLFPLIVQGRAIGVMGADRKHTRRPLEPAILELFQLFASQAAMAIEQARLYEELLAYRDRLRALTAGIVRAREEEARRIAHALHDEAGQLLASVHIALEEVRRGLAPPAFESLQGVKKLLDQIEEQLRHLSHELRPTILDDLGLLPALRFLAEGVSARTGLPITVEGSTEGRLPPPIETALYRITQEALTNAIKHAQATRVGVQLHREDQRIRCAIRDDGIGFDAPAVLAGRFKRGLGLVGIQERLNALGGTLQIASGLGQGSELQITIPVETVDADPDPSGR